jgi:flagellar export protein FliJ
MRRFEFPLERLLQLRSAQLDGENAKLKALYAELRAVEDAARDLKNSDRQTAAGIALSTSVSGAEFGSLASFHRHVLGRLQRLDQRRQTCVENLNNQRGKVIELNRAKRLLELLKEAGFEEWKYELNREIENTAGELFLARWASRSGEAG